MDALTRPIRSCVLSRCSLLLLTRSQLCQGSASRYLSTTSIHHDKKKVVVLGTGWASLCFVKSLDLSRYDLKVVSPRNYFTFTPLLPKVSAGKISSVTCTEPFARFMKRHKSGDFQFVHASCLDLNPKANQVYCQSTTYPEKDITLPYDYLVVAIGAESNTFGIAGVDKHAYFLKEVEHAERIYQKLVSNVEAASLPGLTDEERRSLLHVVVVGGGPTGVEVTGEIALYYNNHVAKLYPELAPYLKITIVEGGERLLATFTPKNSKFVNKVLMRNHVNVLLGSQVCGVGKDDCTVKHAATGKTETLKCGMVIWASGLKPAGLVNKIQKHFKEQNNPRALAVDQYLMLRGNDNRNIFAMGDCSKITPDRLSDHFDEIVNRLGSVNYKKLVSESKNYSREFPQISANKFNPRDNKFTDMCKKLMEEGGDARKTLLEVMTFIDNNYTAPFPTAQNAKQQGVYLAKRFNEGFSESEKTAFTEIWKGSLASIGGKDIVGSFPYFQMNGGLKTLFLWLLVYMRMFSSNKMRLSYTLEALMHKLCGRHFMSKQK